MQDAFLASDVGNPAPTGFAHTVAVSWPCRLSFSLDYPLLAVVGQAPATGGVEREESFSHGLGPPFLVNVHRRAAGLGRHASQKAAPSGAGQVLGQRVELGKERLGQEI